MFLGLLVIYNASNQNQLIKYTDMKKNQSLIDILTFVLLDTSFYPKYLLSQLGILSDKVATQYQPSLPAEPKYQFIIENNNYYIWITLQ